MVFGNKKASHLFKVFVRVKVKGQKKKGKQSDHFQILLRKRLFKITLEKVSSLKRLHPPSMLFPPLNALKPSLERPQQAQSAFGPDLGSFQALELLD